MHPIENVIYQSSPLIHFLVPLRSYNFYYTYDHGNFESSFHTFGVREDR